MLDGEEKISGPRRGRDLQIVERSFRWWGRHWYVVQTRARALLLVCGCFHAYTLHALCLGFYQSNASLLSILSALLSSAALAWFFYSGRCGHLRGLDEYRGQRARALARLSLAFDDGAGGERRGVGSRNEDGGGEWDGSGTWEDRRVSHNRRGKLVRCNYANVSQNIIEAVRLRAMASVSNGGAER